MTSSAAQMPVLQDQMPVPTGDPPATSSHRNPMQQFKAYLRRNLLYTARLVQATEQLLTDEVRTQALHTLSYALSERDLWPLVRALLLALAPKMELGGHREDWLPYLQQGLAQSKALGDFATAAECQLQSGLIARLLSDFAGAREQLTASVALAAQAGEPRTQARALNELAWLEQLQEAYAAAAGYVAQSLTLLDEDDPERAMCYRVLGMIAIGYKDWQTAERLHRRALDCFEQQGDLRRTAWSLQNLAYSLREQSKYAEAFELYQQALLILDQIGDQYHWSIVQTNLGVAYYDIGEHDKAIQCYEKASLVAQSMHDKLQFARLATNFGLAYLAKQEYEQAEDSFKQSIRFHGELGNLSLSINAQDGLVMALIAKKQFKQANKIARSALERLEKIRSSSNYHYLLDSLQKHLQQTETKDCCY